MKAKGTTPVSADFFIRIILLVICPSSQVCLVNLAKDTRFTQDPTLLWIVGPRRLANIKISRFKLAGQQSWLPSGEFVAAGLYFSASSSVQ